MFKRMTNQQIKNDIAALQGQVRRAASGRQLNEINRRIDLLKAELAARTA